MQMRHKIQNAFSRQRAAKVEEDQLSVTSEDSDFDNEAGMSAFCTGDHYNSIHLTPVQRRQHGRQR